MTGSSKCRMHGGSSLAGIASPSFKHGRYSKHLPERLASRYAEALADPKLLELRDDIALLDVRLGELVGRVDTAESASHWKAVQTAHSALKVAIGSKDSAAFQVAMVALGEAVDVGGSDYGLWREIAELVEQRRKLSESERKYQIAAQQMISSEQAMVLLAGVVAVIQRHVASKELLGLISYDLRSLVTVDHNDP